MKKVVLVSFIALVSLSLFAGGGEKKTRTVKGFVTDLAGEPLAGAKIQVKGTKQQVYTDFDGAFTLKEVSESQSVELSHISYQSKDEPLKADRKTKGGFLHFTLLSK